MLIYNRPYIILVATGDRAYVNLHPWHAVRHVFKPTAAVVQRQT